MVMQEKLMTAEAFEAWIALPENRERRLELINGEVVEKMSPTEEHGSIAAALVIMVGNYVLANNLGRIAIEPRHRSPQDEMNTRIPDVAFTSRERLLPLVKEGAVPQMPDLAVEIKSPGDSYTLMREKAAYYLQHGSRMVWLVYPEKQLVEVYTPGSSDILTREEQLSGGEVLPGFSMTVKDIFDV